MAEQKPLENVYDIAGQVYDMMLDRNNTFAKELRRTKTREQFQAARASEWSLGEAHWQREVYRAVRKREIDNAIAHARAVSRGEHYIDKSLPIAKDIPCGEHTRETRDLRDLEKPTTVSLTPQPPRPLSPPSRRQPSGGTYHIHHIDGDHSNNDPANLIRLPNWAHRALHIYEAKHGRISPENLAIYKRECDEYEAWAATSPSAHLYYGPKGGRYR